ncbi:MAG: undecaprenyl-diphosphatase [Thermoanaerobaculia bacterium]|jgi:undecaprenyl-diphosphatase|nr:undecaprenyl-diphosphatase [Thermoanaerobaculia bacterium]
MSQSRARLVSLLGFGCGCAGLFAWLSRIVLQGRANGIDRRIHDWVEECANPALDSAMDVVSALSAPAFLVTATLLVAFAVRKRGRRVFLPIAFSPLAAMTAGSLMTSLMPVRYPPDAASKGYEPCFPSGHVTGATAELLVSCYVLVREQIVPAPVLSVAVVVPLLAGCARVYRGRHWSSDVIAGWLVGTALAAFCAATYEAFRRPTPPALALAIKTTRGRAKSRAGAPAHCEVL